MTPRRALPRHDAPHAGQHASRSAAAISSRPERGALGPRTQRGAATTHERGELIGSARRPRTSVLESARVRPRLRGVVLPPPGGRTVGESQTIGGMKVRRRRPIAVAAHGLRDRPCQVVRNERPAGTTGRSSRASAASVDRDRSRAREHEPREVERDRSGFAVGRCRHWRVQETRGIAEEHTAV